MKSFTQSQKEELEAVVENGGKVFTVSYDPTTVHGNPEAFASQQNWIEFCRETSSNLIEIIYTSP